MRVIANRVVTTVEVEMTVEEARRLRGWLDCDRNSPERRELYDALHIGIRKAEEPFVLANNLPHEAPIEVQS